MTVVKLFVSFRSFLAILALGVVLQGAIVCPAFSQDLSITSDFGAGEFSQPTASAVQNGSANHSYISQSNDTGGNSDNYAEINQDGSENDASIKQSGNQNRTRINNLGTINSALVEQTGDGNSSDISQTNDGNEFYLKQIGDGNSITGSQPGLAIANVEMIGNNNSLSAIQDAGSTFFIRLEGNNLTASVHQGN